MRQGLMRENEIEGATQRGRVLTLSVGLVMGRVPWFQLSQCTYPSGIYAEL
jgi:hypothetical protein